MDTTRIEEMVRGAEKAEEPGDEAREKAIRRESDGTLFQMEGATVTSAGYTWVYDTNTGVPSKINNNNLTNVLRKKREDSSYVFGLKQTVKEVIGTYKCLLHKSDPNRKHYDELGLPVCPKDNLSAPYHVTRHMQKRHKSEWGIIEHERTDRDKERLSQERAEDREFQKMLISKVSSTSVKTKEAPLYVSNKDKGKKTK